MSQTSIPASCPKCKSTKRTKLRRSKRIEGEVVINGEIYDYVTLSYTTCLNCGQVYIVRRPGRNGSKTTD